MVNPLAVQGTNVLPYTERNIHAPGGETSKHHINIAHGPRIEAMKRCSEYGVAKEKTKWEKPVEEGAIIMKMENVRCRKNPPMLPDPEPAQ
ncbi:MAG: hypothetical protein QHI48_01380 [Bacteroidota bacterium]|nr:hypothetical protein [Bacteroidota bacterium]